MYCWAVDNARSISSHCARRSHNRAEVSSGITSADFTITGAMRGGGCGGVIYRSLISGGSGNLLVRGFMRTELRRSGIVHAEPHERQEITSSPPDAVATLTDMDLHFSHRRTSGSFGDSLSTEREHDAITACVVQFRARKTSQPR